MSLGKRYLLRVLRTAQAQEALRGAPFPRLRERTITVLSLPCSPCVAGERIRGRCRAPGDSCLGAS